ncbi:MAG: PepSY domain-containing protein [Kordiimonadaceae bacterium]|nr:PepSY domain-containing protein [Kordiimonadaceae bacterium]
MNAPAVAAFANRLVVDEHDDALQAIKRGEIMSYSQIKKIAERQLKGRVVDLKLRRTNRGWQYFLRISRNDGHVVAAVVDAKTGKILQPR